MKIRKLLKYAAAAVFGLPVVLLAVIGLVNTFDEDLKPEVVELVKRAETEQIAKEGNAYFSIRGLHAPQGQDIELAGRRLDEADRQEMEAFKRGGDLKRIWPPVPAGAPKFDGESANLCTVTMDSLYEHGVCKFQAETDRMFRENSELLRRYYRLLDYRTYEEPATIPPHTDADLVGLMRLANVDMERKLDRGQLDEAARLIVRNLAFWRNALDGKYRLISEAIIRVNYGYSLITLSELLWRKPGLLKRADFRSALGEPMTPNTARLQAQMDREFMNTYLARRGSDLLFPEWPGTSTHPMLKWVANRLYQKNATLNGYHACLEKYYSVRALSGAEHERALSKYQDFDLNGGLDDLLVNLAGKLALREICPKHSWFDLSPYGMLEARRRLVLLEIRLLDSKLSPAKYPALLQSADPNLHDPVTGKPAKWDAKQHIVYFERDGCIWERLWVSLGPTKDFTRCRS